MGKKPLLLGHCQPPGVVTVGVVDSMVDALDVVDVLVSAVLGVDVVVVAAVVEVLAVVEPGTVIKSLMC